jgi:Cys-tRNA(Pro)/Cys-tRNA(Cys) deacylase
MSKEVKTNAIRILEKNKINYEIYTYECEEFVDGVSVINKIGKPLEQAFKTLVTQGKSRNYFVFVIPVAEELDLKKAAAIAGEKSVEMIPVKDIIAVTGYIRGGCSPVGMKKLFKTFIHESAAGLETIIISGGRIGIQIELDPNDLIKAVNGVLADIIVSRG